MKLIHTLIPCLLLSLLTACGGGNYDDNKNAPINSPSTGDNDSGSGGNGNEDEGVDSSGKRQTQKISYDLYDAIPDNFGAGDTLYLDNYVKSDSGLPLTYTITEFYEKGICKLTGEDNNILQTIKEGSCFITAKQDGNNQYLPAQVSKEFRVPKKCPSDERPVYVRDWQDSTKSYYNCVPNYVYIYPLKDIPIGEVGSKFRLDLKGEKLYSEGQALTATLPSCSNVELAFNGEFDDIRILTCDVTQAGDSTLTIYNGSEVLFSASVTFKQPSPIPPMPITKTGITTCSNASENNIDCDNQSKLGDYYNLAQDGKVQSGVAHDYQTIYANNGDTCIQDNATGRIWEVKTDDDGLRDKDWSYHWYNTNSSTNGGNVGNAGSGDDSHLCGNTLPDGLCNSQAYIKALNDANYCGYNDWRMPTLKELVSLMDFSKLDTPPVVDDVFALDTVHTTDVNLRRDYISLNNYWINYSTARFGTSFRDRGEHIRAVRHIDNLPIPTERYEIINEGTEVKDNYTNLVWQRCAIGQTWDGTTCAGDYTNFGWLEGMQQAEALGNGYRLPSIIELVGIANPPKVPYSDGIDTNIFPNNSKRGDLANYLTSSPSTQSIGDDAAIFVYNFGMVSNYMTKRQKGVGRGKTPVRAVRAATPLD